MIRQSAEAAVLDLAFERPAWQLDKIERALREAEATLSDRIGDNLFTGDVLFAEGCGGCHDDAAAHDLYASLQRLKTHVTPCGTTFFLQFSDRQSFAAFPLRGVRDKAKLYKVT